MKISKKIIAHSVVMNTQVFNRLKYISYLFYVRQFLCLWSLAKDLHKPKKETDMVNMKFDYPDKTRDDFLHDVVSQLIFRRLELGITQEELNFNLGVADRLVNKWECGDRTPTSFHLYCWADALDCDLVVISRKCDPHSVKLKKAVNDNLLYEVIDTAKKTML